MEKINSKLAQERSRRDALAPAIASLLADASLYTLDISEEQAISLLKGSRLEINGRVYRASSDSELITRQ
ncbi:hypothetical protein ACOJM8_001911 [Klebsiella aerogenes]|uniref:hypothetical protein n=1 Tax=Klebsiella aerogenes TaxID=548 RepID=UPI001D02A4CF|nr:hypothetical protein [Klebsiella aerogenes]